MYSWSTSTGTEVCTRLEDAVIRSQKITWEYSEKAPHAANTKAACSGAPLRAAQPMAVLPAADASRRIWDYFANRNFLLIRRDRLWRVRHKALKHRDIQVSLDVQSMQADSGFHWLSNSFASPPKHSSWPDSILAIAYFVHELYPDCKMAGNGGESKGGWRAPRGNVRGRGPHRSRGRDGAGTRSGGTKPTLTLPAIAYIQQITAEWWQREPYFLLILRPIKNNRKRRRHNSYL